jgi:integrase
MRISKATKSAMKAAGIEGESFHTLRHYAEARIMPSGVVGPSLVAQVAA